MVVLQGTETSGGEGMEVLTDRKEDGALEEMMAV